MANIFTPTSINISGPWNIAREDCIGDSLGFINANTNYLAYNIIGLSATTNILTTGVTNISSTQVLRLKEGNQQGSMPIYGARAWVNFDPTITTSTITVNPYSRSGTTVTANTTTPHGLSTGMQFWFTTGTGGLATGLYNVSNVISPTQFQFISGVSGPIASGTGTLPRANITAQGGNIAYVSIIALGDYLINFVTPMTDNFYAWSGSVGYDSRNQSAWVGLRHNTPYSNSKTAQFLRVGVYYGNTLLATVHPKEVNVICFR